MLDFIAEDGTRVIDEELVESLTVTRKVRPARGAFGDWNQYDGEGNPTLVIAGVTEEVDLMDDLRNDWGYATQTEQRMDERGDNPTYDPTAFAWFARKNDQVEVTVEGIPMTVTKEKVFGNLPGYHKVGDGAIQCWYCAYTFKAEWFARQDNEVSRNLMEHFAVEAMVHTIECKAEHNGLPLIRMVGYDGKPRHWRPVSMAS